MGTSQGTLSLAVSPRKTIRVVAIPDDPMEAPRQKTADLEHLLEQLTAELRETKKELENLTYSVSHDLRAPLRHIRGYTRILVEDCATALQPQCCQPLKNIEAAAQRMGEMLDALLRLSRVTKQELQRRHVALKELVHELARDLASKAGRNVEWKIASLPVVDCDPALTRDLFGHLLSNALKFTRTRSLPVIEVGTAKDDSQQVFFIRDNGVGFDMKYAENLFSIFQRLHAPDSFEGLGAGLAMAQRIVHKHGGRIWAEAAIGQGATFFFTLEGPQLLLARTRQ